jgi:lipopolysaccharide export system ATP-binding protein
MADRAAGDFAGSLGSSVLSILKPFRRKAAPAPAAAPSELWQIDLGPVGEPMTNGHTEAISLSTSERMPMGRAAAKAPKETIGRAPDRDFDWTSVQQLDTRPHDDDDRPEFDDADYAPPAPAIIERDDNPDHSFERPGQAAAQIDRVLDRVFDLQPGVRPLAAVIPESGALTVQGVEKSFGSRKVVRGVSLMLRRGEAVGLLGPNGAGKTTVFYMITGLIKADAGKIQFDGHDITHLPMYQRARLGIGYLPQEASIFRGLNVEDNIRAVLEVVEPNKKKREEELDKLLDEFNITKLRKTPSIALSGGERRRTEIARALATRPSYMLLDEPFAGIDPIAVGDIQQLVHQLTSRGIGVLITDHNVRETLGLTDRAYIIYSGEVLREGSREEIIHDPEVRRLYLGQDFRM